jgi:VWFA-related protein
MAGKFLAFILTAAGLAVSTAAAQTQSAQPAYTLQANARVVLTDVTVLDSKGNPVKGLPQSEFRIFDDGKQQHLASFEEHDLDAAAQAVAPPVLEKGAVSNAGLEHLPPVLNIILIDVANMDVPDQMFLYHQLEAFLRAPQPGQLLAIYMRSTSGVFPMQTLTSDRQLLLAALRRSIPRVKAIGQKNLDDFDTLRQITYRLRGIPGRKNLLWFSGGSTLEVGVNSTTLYASEMWREVYAGLEQGRIAVYPIDARGLQARYPGMDTKGQHPAMETTALATGGQAFYNNSGLAEYTEQVMAESGCFYTLTYTPANLKLDGKWHDIRVEVEGKNLTASHRKGYFASPPGSSTQPVEAEKKKLLVNGKPVDNDAPPPQYDPIVFEARVTRANDPALAQLSRPTVSFASPQPDPKMVTYSIRYLVKPSALNLQTVNGQPHASIAVAAIAMDDKGLSSQRAAQGATVELNADFLKDHPDVPVLVDQQVNLKPGEQSLYLLMWDMTNQRVGTVEVSLKVPKS